MTQYKKDPLAAQKTFPTRLRGLMGEQCVSRASLAKTLGVTRQAVANYLDGSSSPSWENIALIAKTLGVSSDYLLGLSEYRSRRTENVTLSELGLSEQSVNNLLHYCSGVHGMVVRLGIKNKRQGLDLLLSSSDFWESRLLPGIALLKTQIDEISLMTDEGLYMTAIKSEIHEHFADFSLSNVSLSLVDYLDFRITQSNDLFYDVVSNLTGYTDLNKRLNSCADEYNAGVDNNGIDKKENN